MILYHGTNVKFSKIDLQLSKDKRDFGKGFYTTSIFEQAEKWVKNQFIRYGGNGSIVKIFEYEPTSRLKVLQFDSMSKQWLEFVKENRTGGGINHDYDLVIGPVANDNTMRTIALYVAGIYNAEQALEQLAFFNVNDQFSFHTEKALSHLVWKEDKKV